MEQKVIDEIEKIVGKDGYSVDPAVLYTYGFDASIFHKTPDMVVQPRSTEEVSEIMKVASKYKIPVTPRGAGTGLCGAAVPIKGGIVLAMQRMNKVLRVSVADLWVDVEAGCVYNDLNAELEKYGFFFPPSPGSAEACQVGGMVATNASGMRAVKYGATRDFVMGLTFVKADGEIVRCGTRTIKDASGFEFLEQEMPFRYDDALFLYTDGLTEAENAAHEQFGEGRMEAALHGRKSAQAHLDNIKQQVSGFVGDAPQSDDLTILFIHYVPSSRRLILQNSIDQVALLPAFVQDAVKASKLGAEMADSLNLALEEAVVNVIDYAYPEGTSGEVIIDAAVTDTALTFTITDNGKPFDPTARPEVDIHAGVEDRPIGGLGIHLVRQIMDDVRYERRGEKNVLVLTKKY